MTEACGIEEKDREKAIRMSMVSLWCVQDSAKARPPMSAVVKIDVGRKSGDHATYKTISLFVLDRDGCMIDYSCNQL